MTQTRNQITIQALAFASQLLPAIIGVGSFMLLVRATTPVVLGEYIVYLTAVVLFEMVKSGGLQSALVMRVSTDNKEHQLRIIGSAYWLGGLFAIAVSLILITLFFTGVFAKQPGIQVFCGWYAVLGLVTLPLHIAEAEGVAKQDLVFLLLLRVSQSANALIIAIYSYFRGGDLKDFATVHLLFTLCLMLIILVLRKTNPLSVRYKTIEEIKALFKLIKYTLATLATTNILKSADTFLISSFMGPAAVAKYAIPLKLTEFFEIPLRSLSTTAFPQLAAKNNEGDLLGFKNTFVQYISWAYMLYIPGLILTLFVAPYLVLIIGGKQYADTTPIFMVFILYGLLLPSDRMTGISLDALQKPALNFRKVFIMAIVNILADLAAIYFTHRLEWVAFASVLNVLTGAILGFTMLERTNCLPRFSVWKEVSEYSFSFARKVIAQKNK